MDTVAENPSPPVETPAWSRCGFFIGLFLFIFFQVDLILKAHRRRSKDLDFLSAGD